MAESAMSRMRCQCLWRCGRGAAEEEEPEYRIRVEGFQQVTAVVRTARGRRVRQPHMVYLLSVSHGNARWPLRRRFRQIALLHGQLLQGFGRSEMARGLPKLPPRVTLTSLVCGRMGDRFLSTRAARIETYFRELLRFIPFVDQCEALNEFLNSAETDSMDYDALLDLGEALGQCGAPQGADEEAIAQLPRRPERAEGSLTDGQTNCVICQEELLPGEDVRVLPCGHEYHYHCIARWAAQKNNCCVCQGMAVLPRPAEDSETDK